MLGASTPTPAASCADALEPVSVPGGSVLIREGDPADCLYLVAAGRLRVVSIDADGEEIHARRDRPGRPRRRDGADHQPAADGDRLRASRHAPPAPLDRRVHPARRGPSRVGAPDQHRDGGAPAAVAGPSAGRAPRWSASRILPLDAEPAVAELRRAPRARARPAHRLGAPGRRGRRDRGGRRGARGPPARGVVQRPRDRERGRRLPRRPGADDLDPRLHPPGRPPPARRRRDHHRRSCAPVERSRPRAARSRSAAPSSCSSTRRGPRTRGAPHRWLAPPQRRPPPPRPGRPGRGRRPRGPARAQPGDRRRLQRRRRARHRRARRAPGAARGGRPDRRRRRRRASARSSPARPPRAASRSTRSPTCSARRSSTASRPSTSPSPRSRSRPGAASRSGCRKRRVGLDIEDAWLNGFCVSTNLTRGEVEVHRSGPAWLAHPGELLDPRRVPADAQRGRRRARRRWRARQHAGRDHAGLHDGITRDRRRRREQA